MQLGEEGRERHVRWTGKGGVVEEDVDGRASVGLRSSGRGEL